jgi:hypothetical protein
MTLLHPVLQPASGGLQSVVVFLAAAFGDPGQDETMSIVIPLRIRYQRRVARHISMKLPSEDPAGLSDRAKFWKNCPISTKTFSDLQQSELSSPRSAPSMAMTTRFAA